MKDLDHARIDNYPREAFQLIFWLDHYFYGGWWEGWNSLCNQFDWQEAFARKIMRQLREDGLVHACPIFDEQMKLNGKGWFLTDEGYDLKQQMDKAKRAIK